MTTTSELEALLVALAATAGVVAYIALVAMAAYVVMQNRPKKVK
jgi:hypothetical protein